VYLISRFFSIRENRENFMLAKYTWFTVYMYFKCCIEAVETDSVVAAVDCLRKGSLFNLLRLSCSSTNFDNCGYLE